jgi:hypothetical protein
VVAEVVEGMLVDRSDMETELARVRAMLDAMAGRRLHPGLSAAQQVRWRGLESRESQLLESLRAD